MYTVGQKVVVNDGSPRLDGLTPAKLATLRLHPQRFVCHLTGCEAQVRETFNMPDGTPMLVIAFDDHPQVALMSIYESQVTPA